MCFYILTNFEIIKESSNDPLHFWRKIFRFSVVWFSTDCVANAPVQVEGNG